VICANANDFDNLADLARTLNAFEQHSTRSPSPSSENFTRDDLDTLIKRLTQHQPQLQLAA
jgi:hypothetical protein